ncbi:hypothetical protein L2E82_36224 [Cichorium intybus]|uniref:Uncharacterized protein n=1 Tax=Cichorium intybus TaxID=13427 RepID=A0ACB9BR86_CICIN|nr:hypothetical protein L2E82_36224 [Cichorium intybus]
MERYNFLLKATQSLSIKKKDSFRTSPHRIVSTCQLTTYEGWLHHSSKLKNKSTSLGLVVPPPEGNAEIQSNQDIGMQHYLILYVTSKWQNLLHRVEYQYEGALI